MKLETLSKSILLGAVVFGSVGCPKNLEDPKEAPVLQHEDPPISATMVDVEVTHRLLSHHYEICNVRLRAERLAHHHGYMQELPNGAGYEVVVDPRSGFWKTQETLIHEWAHVLHHVYGPNDWLSVEDSPHIGSSPCSLNHNSTWGRYYADVYRTATCE